MPLLFARRRCSRSRRCSSSAGRGERIWPHDWTPLLIFALSSQVLGQGLLVYSIGTLPPMVVGLALLDPAGDLRRRSAGSPIARRLSLADIIGALAIAAALVLVRLPRAGLANAAGAAQLSAMDDPSPLEQLRRQLALAVGENAVFDGWTTKAVDSAAGAARHRPGPGAARHAQGPGGDDRPLHPGGRPRARCLVHAGAAAGLKIREKIRAIVWRRLEIMAPAREAVRRALAILAMPQNVPLALAHRLADRGRRCGASPATPAPTSTITPSG